MSHDTHQPDHSSEEAVGRHRHTNALIHESSPYLLQHAHNPVNWYPWGPEAFELARREDKPIFLSIGYSTCYWCHVMERQSFENEAVAEKLNANFISIKVDREERPDVDDIYMTAVQAFSGSGGWPMSVFLTPPGTKGSDDAGLRPFFAGTYFPPQSAHGRPGFSDLLDSITTAWRVQRDEINAQAQQLTDAITQYLQHQQRSAALNPQTIQDAANQLLRNYDVEHGGFGNAPKFPTPNNLLFLLKVHENNPNPALRQAIDHSLDAMARGGMYDQVGGGFHRYSTDARWLVPHFEKMLYDNGQLVELYLKAAVPGRESVNADDPSQYHRIARQTCEYVLREMLDPTGSFWSAQDAEVDALEGANYVWTVEEVRDAIKDRALSDLAIVMYGLDKGPNFQDPHASNAKPVNVLYLPTPLPELARQQGISLEELIRTKQSIDQRLLQARNQRKQPGTDDKVLTPWNGMMIAGLARAGRDLDDSRFTDAAAKAGRYILDRMRTEDGGLYRTMRKDQAKIPAFLEGYAWFMHGLIELYRTQSDRHWLDAAEAFAMMVQHKFGAEQGGYYDTLAGQTDLLVRTRSSYDGAIPSGNSQMIHNLIDLYEITGQEKYLNLAVRDLQSFAADLARQGAGQAHMQHALLRAIEHRPEIAPFDESASTSGKRQVVWIDVQPKLIDLQYSPVTLEIQVNIGPDYHLNASQLDDQNLVPTTLELLDAPGLELKVKYPVGEQRRYPMSDQSLLVYEGKQVIEATIRKIEDLPAGSQPKLVLSYQVCTDHTCLEPRSVELPVEFRNVN